MSQTSYNAEQGIALAGMKADSRFDEVESFAAESAVAFGLGVIAGTDPAKQVKVAAAVGDTFRGIALHTNKAQTVAGVSQYDDKDTVSVMRKGVAWVPVTDPVTIDGAAYVDLVTNTGYFTGAATANLTVTIDAIFRSNKNSATGLAKVEVSMPK